MNEDIFFIIGCSRSGTTAVTKVLDTATNAEIFVEQKPKLCINTRIQYEYGLNNSKEYIGKAKEEQIKQTLEKGLKYGDKNPNYLFFVEELIDNFDCRFLFIYRDGRDTVRSIMDWDKEGKIHFGRYEDNPESNIVEPEDNFWDFARIRPVRNSNMMKKWINLSKFEKNCWYWSKFNEIMLNKIKNLDDNRYYSLDVTNSTSKEIKEIFSFLGLKGFNENTVNGMLNSRINSLKDNWDKKDDFPNWKDWNKKRTQIFNKYAEKAMKNLGYYDE